VLPLTGTPACAFNWRSDEDSISSTPMNGVRFADEKEGGLRKGMRSGDMPSISSKLGARRCSWPNG